MKTPNLNIDYIAKRKVLFAIPILLIIAAAMILVIFGLDANNKYNDVTEITYSYAGEPDFDSVKSTVEEQFGMSVSIRISNSTALNNLIVSVANEDISEEDVDALTEKLQDEYSDNFADTTATLYKLSAQSGQQYYLRCLVATGVVLIILFLYTVINFRRIGGWSAGLVTIITLLLNMALVLAAFAILRLKANDSLLIALLAALVYSIMNSTMLFESIRENKKVMGKKAKIGEVVNTSIAQAGSRITSIAIILFLSLLVFLIVSIIYTNSSLIGLAVALIVAVIASVYSSLFVAGPLWSVFQEKKEKKS